MKALALLFLCCLPAVAKTHPPTEIAKVISQNVGPVNGGSVATANGSSIGNTATASAIGVPIVRAFNTVVIETPKRRLMLLEITGRNYMLLTVNGTVNFYVDGNRAILEDSGHKKHKFFITRMEDITQEK